MRNLLRAMIVPLKFATRSWSKITTLMRKFGASWHDVYIVIFDWKNVGIRSFTWFGWTRKIRSNFRCRLLLLLLQRSEWGMVSKFRQVTRLILNKANT